MSVNDNWDVEQHKMEHESDEHWELRRKFLLTHKDKFSEDVAVCLAQVFVNVELLGCRYPKETMDLVEDLSRDIATEYREKQKKKIQRTFVEASEAASSKVKGRIARKPIVTEECGSDTSNRMANATSRIERSCGKFDTKRMSSFSNNVGVPVSNTIDNNYRSDEKRNIEEIPPKRLKTEEETAFRECPYGDIVLWEKPGDTARMILSTSARISGVNLDWKYTQRHGAWECCIDIGSRNLGHYTNLNKKTAKNEAAAIALDKLRKHCYTVKVKDNVNAKSNVTVTTKEIKRQEQNPDGGWKGPDCIGKRLMRMMGWTGGGLGKSGQGIVEPMSATLKPQISRKGLGLEQNCCTAREMKMKCQSLFRDFLQTDMQNDIVFLDFTKEERAVIHRIARTMGLKSRSHSTEEQRKLIVSRKIDVRSLVRELKTLGGVTEKYELVKPPDEKFASSSGSIKNK